MDRFNPRSRTGSDIKRKLQCHADLCFNPRSRTGSDVELSLGGVRHLPASIHAPARGATRPMGGLFVGGELQSTLPHGERLTGTFAVTLDGFASIHAPARGATCHGRARARGRDASIHAPARGATFRYSLQRREQSASIHAPARGATQAGEALGLDTKLQSTLPHGERLAGQVAVGGADAASIHAPARGATRLLQSTP